SARAVRSARKPTSHTALVPVFDGLGRGWRIRACRLYCGRPSQATRARERATPQQETQPMVLTPDFAARPVINFQHVHKRYPTGTEAPRDINLEVPEGDFLFLVGPSGAGKSTLVRLLIREEKPTKGKIFVDGVELGRMKRRKLPFYRRKVGLVFQDFKLLPN